MSRVVNARGSSVLAIYGRDKVVTAVYVLKYHEPQLVVYVKAGEDLVAFEEEVASPSRDPRARNVAGEDTLQPSNPGGGALEYTSSPLNFRPLII